MNILVIGGGGREHALCWKLAQSPQVDRLICAPGNAGIGRVAECVGLDADDHDAVVDFCRENDVDMVVVGPEAPLVAGLVDRLTTEGIDAFGPTAAAARLEGSKGFTKDICKKYGIPTADYGRFDNPDEARDYIRRRGAPIVIKADGLAAGKGVVVARTIAEAERAVEDAFSGAYGAAGRELVIEECLAGEEASFFAFVDGKTVLALADAQDHKAVGEGDSGPNTGGMGAYSPASVMTDELRGIVMREIMQPTVAAMNKEGTPYKGVLYAGLMLTTDGPKLIEFNVRFGDPECQVLMMRLAGDIVPALRACIHGNLDTVELDWRQEAALTVVLASRGYPGSYEKGSEIRGCDDAAREDDVEIFHAGTQRDDDTLRAVGGRVLNVTALGRNVTEAQAKAYRAVHRINWPEGFFRRDIGFRAVARERGAA